MARLTYVCLLALIMGVTLASGALPPSLELTMYRHRTQLLYSRLQAASCPIPSEIMTKRDLISDRVQNQLNVERSLYTKLTDLLVSCQKSKGKT